jgi:hypothetical protein
MIPAVRITGGSYHFAAAGWQKLATMGPNDPVLLTPGGQNLSGAVMLTNGTAATIYFAFADSASVPGSNPAASGVGTFGNIPVPPNAAIVVSQPNGVTYWGASAAGLDATPVEVIKT